MVMGTYRRAKRMFGLIESTALEIKSDLLGDPFRKTVLGL
jgi:hypothetical protein